ncbi:hypothetical protein MIND_00116600 [Mycena indigotica]|uniref:Uncharacterized protein n=1 Tax=Mycena indigotica TaxID=2126181 RepID=A0A8H6WIC9_9AGAR|nr:uncharacterized protein MIND_00116600 [Mycena indigotica]KAF7315993.1 hypothetical protein MIND_00116600 [Mycena indigotica]
MHPLAAARVKALNSLPSPHREVALAACQLDCSDSDYCRFDRLWLSADSTLYGRLFLVLFAVLDSERIPPLARIEDLSSTEKRQIHHVYGVFDMCSFVIAWVEFLYDAHDFLLLIKDVVTVDDKMVLPPKTTLLVGFAHFTRAVEVKWVQKYECDIDRLAGNLGPSRVFWNSPAYLRLMVDAWQYTLSHPRPDVSMLHDCIAMIPATLSHSQLDVLLDAAGGSVDSLVRFVKKHLTLVDEVPAKLRTRHFIILSCRPLELLLHVEELLVADSSNRGPVQAGAVAESLVSCHLFPKVLVVLDAALDMANTPSNPAPAEFWLRTLRTVLSVTNTIIDSGSHPLRIALHHDFLPRMLQIALFLPDELLSANLQRNQHVLNAGQHRAQCVAQAADGTAMANKTERDSLKEMVACCGDPLAADEADLKKAGPVVVQEIEDGVDELLGEGSNDGHQLNVIMITK